MVKLFIATFIPLLLPLPTPSFLESSILLFFTLFFFNPSFFFSSFIHPSLPPLFIHFISSSLHPSFTPSLLHSIPFSFHPFFLHPPSLHPFFPPSLLHSFIVISPRLLLTGNDYKRVFCWKGLYLDALSSNFLRKQSYS